MDLGWDYPSISLYLFRGDAVNVFPFYLPFFTRIRRNTTHTHGHGQSQGQPGMGGTATLGRFRVRVTESDSLGRTEPPP